MTGPVTRPRRGNRHSPLVERVLYQLARVRAWAHRVTLAGLSIRVAIWLAGTAGLVLALPPGVRLGPAPVIAALLGLAAAGFPAGTWPTTVQVLAVSAFAVAVATGAWRPSVPDVLLLAAVLYAHHTTAALGAQLRTDAVVPPAVLRHWAGRTALVLAVSTLLSLGIVGLAGHAPGWSAAGLVGLGVVGALAATLGLVWLVPDRGRG